MGMGIPLSEMASESIDRNAVWFPIFPINIKRCRDSAPMISADTIISMIAVSGSAMASGESIRVSSAAVSNALTALSIALIVILAIEAGILTPPFGLLVYAVKAVVPDRDVKMMEIFIGSTPYWIMLLIVIKKLVHDIRTLVFGEDGAA